MISLSYRTVHECDDAKPNTVNTIHSAGFQAGTIPCCRSVWAEANNIDHATVEELDLEIEKGAQDALEEALAEFQVYHRDGYIRGEIVCSIL
jgi:hypothetical protein